MTALRRLLVLLAACSSAPHPGVANSSPPPAVITTPAEGRAVIEHRFLAHPISVPNPSNAPLSVATATGSLMLVTIDLGDGVGMLVSGDGKTAGLGAPPPGTVLSQGTDPKLQWRVMRGPNGIEPDAFNVATGVYCAIYQPEVRTQAMAERVIAACRDIHVATAEDLADTSHIYRGD